MFFDIVKLTTRNNKINLEKACLAIENPDLRFPLPNAELTEQFKSLAAFLKMRNHELLYEQAAVFKNYYDTRDAERFVKEFAQLKKMVANHYLEHMDDNIEQVALIDTFWKELSIKHPEYLDEEFSKIAEIEKINEKIHLYNEFWIMEKKEILETIDSGGIIDFYKFCDKLIDDSDMVGSFLTHTSELADIFSELLKDPSIVDIFCKIFGL